MVFFIYVCVSSFIKNSFRNIITYQNIKSSSNLKNILSKSQNNFFINRQKETEESRQRLATIVTLLPELKRKYFISLDQKMSYEELLDEMRNSSKDFLNLAIGDNKDA